MYNSSTAFSSSNTQYKSRLFIYEVEGLSKNSVDTKVPLRGSGTVFITVPYSRMNQEMRRINSLGGKVISIKPAGNNAPEQASQPAPKQQAQAHPKIIKNL